MSECPHCAGTGKIPAAHPAGFPILYASWPGNRQVRQILRKLGFEPDMGFVIHHQQDGTVLVWPCAAVGHADPAVKSGWKTLYGDRLHE